jgi:hypothetical protein
MKTKLEWPLAYPVENCVFVCIGKPRWLPPFNMGQYEGTLVLPFFKETEELTQSKEYKNDNWVIHLKVFIGQKAR